ncbi:MAG: polyprenyl synthetase family protein [Candidatus Krumholzibacteria bacterium]|nr:polyprenyl synthetase family protein [Candidatus Krumholzibacteria bacterium]
MIHALKKYAVLSDVIERCNRVVLDTLAHNTIQEAAIAIESFNNGGKRLRPALLILASMVPDGRGFDDVEADLIDLAAAVELVHLSTLFHDDVIDEVDHRRTKPSARTKYGNYVSVLTGDFVLAEALALVQRSNMADTIPEFIRTLRVLIRGESLETRHKFDYDLNEAQYYDIISEKSASLFALSCKLGGLSRGNQYADTLGHFGWNLGMAFQMIDDLDDMLENPNRSHDCDLRNGYLALPMIRVLSSLEDGYRDQLVRIIEGAEIAAENERFIVSLCLEHGAIEETGGEIRRHLDRAASTLEKFGDSESKDLLTYIVSDLKAYSENQITNFANFVEASP